MIFHKNDKHLTIYGSVNHSRPAISLLQLTDLERVLCQWERQGTAVFLKAIRKELKDASGVTIKTCSG